LAADQPWPDVALRFWSMTAGAVRGEHFATRRNRT
jgi:hypothetical protein